MAGMTQKELLSLIFIVVPFEKKKSLEIKSKILKQQSKKKNDRVLTMFIYPRCLSANDYQFYSLLLPRLKNLFCL